MLYPCRPVSTQPGEPGSGVGPHCVGPAEGSAGTKSMARLPRLGARDGPEGPKRPNRLRAQTGTSSTGGLSASIAP